MSDIQTTEAEKEEALDFGDYVRIEQKRYGIPNEQYLYKVIGRLKSNGYVDVPVQTPPTESTHDTIAEVVACVCCGVSEREVRNYRVSDVRLERSIRADAVKAEWEKHAAVFRIAANAIYFDDSSDYQSALYEIIETLKPGYEPGRMPFCETVEDAMSILSDDQEAHRG